MAPLIKRCNQLLGWSFSLVIERKKHRRVKVRCVSSRDLPVEDICVGLQFTSDHSRINMESHNSHDKLVSLESGLSLPVKPSVERSRKSQGCTKRILIYVATVLLIVAGYEIWQSVRSDYLLQKLEDERQTLPSALDDIRLDDMAEELSRVRIELKELKERMDQRAQTTTPNIIESPETTTIVESIPEETTEDLDPEIKEWLVSFADHTSNDDVKDSNSNTEIPSTTEAPEVTIIDEEIIEDPIVTSHIDEPESGWGWKVYFSFGQRDEGEKNSSEEADIIETDVGEPTQVEDEGYMHRFTNLLRTSWRFGWGNSSEEDQSKTDNEEKMKSDIVDVDTTTTPDPIVVDYWADLYDEDYNLYEEYASYEYPSSLKLGDHGNVKSKENEDATTGVDLEFTPSEFDLSSTSVEDEPEISSPKMTNEFLDSLELFANSKRTMDEPSSDELNERLVDFFKAYHQDEMIPSTTTTDEYGWTHISKRSIDSASTERPMKSLSPEEMSRKLDIIHQAVDDENHILQNELIVAPGPMKNILRQKIDNFYRKMEAVSAHIDRLHQKYLKTNKLEDDYVSREFPSDEDNSTMDLVDRR